MGLGTDVGVQTGVFRQPLSEKGKNILLSAKKDQTLDRELERMAIKQAIEPVKDSSQATFVSPMFVVTKVGGSWRPVINLKCYDQIGSQGHLPVCSITGNLWPSAGETSYGNSHSFLSVWAVHLNPFPDVAGYFC